MVLGKFCLGLNTQGGQHLSDLLSVLKEKLAGLSATVEEELQEATEEELSRLLTRLDHFTALVSEIVNAHTEDDLS